MLRKVANGFGVFKPKDYRVFMTGIDASGKTAILYRLKLGEMVTTIPTIGFNVEAVEHGKSIFTIWDVGGCDKIRPLFRHYMTAETDVIDSCDKERFFDDWKEELERHMRVDEMRGKPILFYLNKQDANPRDPLRIEEVKEVVESLLDQIYRGDAAHRPPYHLQPCSAVTGEGVQEGLAWMADVLNPRGQTNRWGTRRKRDGDDDDSATVLSDPRSRPSESELLQRIENGVDEPKEASIFLERFNEGIVASFDHRAHLRVGFHVLLGSLQEGLSVSAATDRFIRTLLTFFEKSDRKQIRQTFHFSMTVFWCRVLCLALRNFSHECKEEDGVSEEELFQRFLKAHTELSWGGLWTQYYSKDLLMSEKARKEFVLPDLKPLPSFMVTKPLTMAKRDGATAGNNDGLEDGEFLEACLDTNALSTFSDVDVVRFLYLWLVRAKIQEKRRGAAVNELLPILQSILIRVRARGCTSAPEYSVTMAYFYLQLVDMVLSREESHGSRKYLPFYTVLSLYPDLNPSNRAWSMYYTESIFKGVGARREFTPPDRSALPTVISRNPATEQSKWMDSDNLEIVDINELVRSQISLINEQNKDMQQSQVGYEGPRTSMFVKHFENVSKGYLNHITMVRLAYSHLVEARKNQTKRSEITGLIMDSLEKYWETHGDVATVGVPFTNDLSAHPGFTYMVFWIQMIIAALARVKRVEALTDFACFLEGAPELAWHRLHVRYYSDERISSQEARVLFIPPDRKALPSFLP